MLNTHIYGSGKDLLGLLRIGTGSDVHIMDGPPQNGIPNGAPHKVGFKTSGL